MMDIQNELGKERGLRIRIAQECKITHGAVYQWRSVPPEHVLTVERMTGIPRTKLRPDIFGPSKPSEKAKQ